jgi:hypothetical protein
MTMRLVVASAMPIVLVRCVATGERVQCVVCDVSGQREERPRDDAQRGSFADAVIPMRELPGDRCGPRQFNDGIQAETDER